MLHFKLTRGFTHRWAYSTGRLRRPSVDFHPHSSNTFFAEMAVPTKPDFIWSLHGLGERKFVWGVWVTWPRWPPGLYGKNSLKIFFFGTKGPMTLGLSMQHQRLRPNKICSNDDLGLTLSFFLARSNLIWENTHFFRKNVRKSFNGRNL